VAVDPQVLQQIALSAEEYEGLVRRLGREPNAVELGIVGALWSEHCGYKNSKLLLQLFPTQGDRVLTRAGSENAGAVDVGDGLCVVFKVESHNHPSAIEPYQGAATGVGGIVRDVFAMGAQPIALLDSLRFGPIEGKGAGDPIVARNRYLVGGVVAGIAGYGNCLGIPTVGGETSFAESYSGNPLVNAMCVGVAQSGSLLSARADGPGNALILVGADTGRDGIHGATFASVELDERSEERRPAVQVGNPFLEKLLMEACQELARTDWLVGLQDLGAAGLTSAAIECAAKSGTGVEIDVARVPRRERGMAPYDVMLSESQERMLVIARAGYEQRITELFRRWDLDTAVIGRVLAEPVVRVVDADVEVAYLPVGLCTEPPLYRRQGVPDAGVAAQRALDLDRVPDLAKASPDGANGSRKPANAVLFRLLASPNIASKRWIYRQYDHQVLTNTVQGPGGDAAVLRLKGTQRGIALTLDGNSRLCRLDPYVGGAIAVAEAARNLACVGAQPLAMTNCLNFGNPEKPEVYDQLEQAIRGMSAACEALGTPVVSGNVSLYNESGGSPIDPTPVVGMLGLLEQIDSRCGHGFRNAGDVVLLLGAQTAAGGQSLAASEYLERLHGMIGGCPRLDLELEIRLQGCLLEASRGGMISSAHDCAEGGLAVALVECCLSGGLGFDGSGLRTPGRDDAFLFGEDQSRIVVSAAVDAAEELEALATLHGVPISRLGTVTASGFRIAASIECGLNELAAVYETAFGELLGA
jgi:phosphoribosylformylglycinamidine synthase subunit PurL